MNERALTLRGEQLITIKKTTYGHFASPFKDTGEAPAAETDRRNEHDGRTPAHKDFREKYFRGFRRDGDEDEPEAATKQASAVSNENQ